MSANVSTTTAPESAAVSNVARIMAAFAAAAAAFNTSKDASAHLAADRKFRTECLAREIMDLPTEDRGDVVDALESYADIKGAFKAFAKAILKATDKIDAGRKALSRQ